MSYENIHPLRFLRTHPFARKLVRQVANQSPGGVITEAGLHVISREASRHYNDLIDQMPRADRPGNADVLFDIVSDIGHLATFAAFGRNTFVIGNDLVEMFLRTDISGIRLSDIHLPFPAFHIAFPSGLPLKLPGPDNVIDGVYVEGQFDGELTFYFTAYRRDGEKNFITGHEPHFFAPLPADAETLEDAIFAAVADGRIETKEGSPSSAALREAIDDLKADGAPVAAPPETGDDRAARRNRTALPAVRQALSVVGNALCYLSSQPLDDASEEWPGASDGEVASLIQGKSRKARQKARGELLKKGLMPVRVLRFEQSSGGGLGICHETAHRRTHWRRGHWRRQPFGAARSDVRLTWIRPTLVGRGDQVESASRVYVVDGSRGSGEV